MEIVAENKKNEPKHDMPNVNLEKLSYPPSEFIIIF